MIKLPVILNNGEFFVQKIFNKQPSKTPPKTQTVFCFYKRYFISEL